MGKSITIFEGLQAKNFSNVSKVRINNIGGGTSDWIPEEEAGLYANLGEATIDKNGTYKALDEELDGFSQVTVNVQPKVATKTITQNGTYRANKDKVDGFSEVSVQVPTGANLISKSISENGTYNASDENADGYSSVTVNVGGGGGSTLITKEITANGTYNASADNADGYSSVTVNVSTGHGNKIIGDVNNASVGSRIATKDFWYDFDEKLWFSIEQTLVDNTSSRPQWIEQIKREIRDHGWLEWNDMKNWMGYNNVAIFAAGRQSGGTTRIAFYVFGIADDSATISITNADADSFTITISDDTKFYSAGSTGVSFWEWRFPNTGAGGFGQKTGAINAIDGGTLWGNTGQPNTVTINLSTAGTGTGLMTNLMV